MRGNLSKRGLGGSKGEKGDKGDMPNIEFRINPETGELEYRYNGMLVDREYISSHDIVTKDQVNELKQLVISFDDKYVGDKTFEEIVKAINEGKEIVGVMPPITNRKREMLRFTVSGCSDTNITLMTIIPWVQLIITCNKDNIWSSSLVNLVTEDMLSNTVNQKLMVVEKTANKVTHINKDTAKDDKYPSENAVVQHVATETSTAKGEMEGLAKDYKRECDEKINAQNQAISAAESNLRTVFNTAYKNSMNISTNTTNIKTNADAIDNLQQKIDQIETNCDSRLEHSNFRIDSVYSMLESQENKNETQEGRLDGHDVDIELLQKDVYAESEQNKLQDAQISDLTKAINEIVIGGGGSGGSAFVNLIVDPGVTFQKYADSVKTPGTYQLTRKESIGNKLTSCSYLVVTKQGQYADGCSQFLMTSGEFSESPSLMFRQFTYTYNHDTNAEEEYFTEWVGVVGQNAINKILNGEDAVGLANRAYSDNEGNVIHETYAPLDGLLTGLIKVHEAHSADTALQAYDDINGNMIHDTYATKAELRPTPVTDVPSTLVANTPYNFGEQTELSLLFPTTANDGDVIYISFLSRDIATNLTVDTTNTTEIDLVPETNTGYEIYAKYNQSIACWIVKYSEYSIEGM